MSDRHYEVELKVTPVMGLCCGTVLRDRFSLAFVEKSNRDECYREAARLICGCVVEEFAAHHIPGWAD